MALLELRNVTREFGGVKAVSDLSFAVERGTITSLIGPNGAGKTTVVNLITGIYLPSDGGNIIFSGEDISRLEPADVARTGISRTFQNIRLLKERSVLSNILGGFYMHGKSSFISDALGLRRSRRELAEFEVKSKELLSRFGMAAYQHHAAGSLSYGHQRKLEIMRALATNPSLLILDEPVAGMNDVEASEMGRTFQELAAGGTAVLLIEHNMRLVQNISDVVHVIDAGRHITSGAPRAVLNDPRVIEVYLGAARA